MLNHITIMGRLTRDPELRRTGSGVAVASFRIAVDRDYSPKDGGEKKCDFIDCVAWRQTGEFISKYFSKGRMIVVDGRLEMREWTDKDGNKRISAEVNVNSAYFGDSKQNTGSQAGSYATSENYNQPAAPGYGQPAAPDNGQPAAPGYGQPAPGGYSVPGYGAHASDFAMLEDDDAQLPF